MRHTPDPIKMTKTERIHWSYAVDALRMIEHDLLDVLRLQQGLPDEWHDIWIERDRRDGKRERVTVSLDADVLKFFRAMGQGYGPRINRILRAYMHLRLSKLVEGPDTTDFVLRPEEVIRKGRVARPRWGDVGAGT